MLVIAPILTCPSDDSEDTCDEEGAASASATAAASAWESLSHGEVSDIGTRRVAKYVAPVVAVPFVPKPVSTLSQKTALVSGSGSSDAMVLNAACPNDWGDVPSRGEPGTPEGRTLNTGAPSKKQRCSSESATHSCTSTMDGMRSACELDEFAASQESMRACLDSPETRSPSQKDVAGNRSRSPTAASDTACTEGKVAAQSELAGNTSSSVTAGVESAVCVEALTLGGT